MALSSAKAEADNENCLHIENYPLFLEVADKSLKLNFIVQEATVL